MRYALPFLFLLFTFPAFAADPAVETSGLTPGQASELKQAAERMRSGNLSTTVREETKAWADLGANIGSALVGAAKEIGTASSEFAETPLGKVVVAVVVFKLIGKTILGIVLGLGFGVFVVVLFWYLRKRVFMYPVYETKPCFFGLREQKVRVKYVSNNVSDEAHVTSWLILIVGEIAAFATVATSIANA